MSEQRSIYAAGLRPLVGECPLLKTLAELQGVRSTLGLIVGQVDRRCRTYPRDGAALYNTLASASLARDFIEKGIAALERAIERNAEGTEGEYSRLRRG